MITWFYMLFIAFAFCSCTVSKKVQDKQDRTRIEYVEKNKERLHDAAAFAIGFTWDDRVKEFTVNEIPDRKMRRLLSDFGYSINVYYNKGGDLHDSTVTFNITNFWGVKEIIYCFAVNPVNRTPFINRNQALFKITNNIYYTRRPFPMM